MVCESCKHTIGLISALDILVDTFGRPVYELSNYIVLSRLLHYIPQLSPLHPARVVTTFLGISIIVELLTSNGAAEAVNSTSTPAEISIGKGLLKAALILQLFVLLAFVSVAGRFHYNCMKAGHLDKLQETRAKILGVLITLYISSALIGTRTIYRTIEYFATADIKSPKPGETFDPLSISPVIRYEWFFYVFEVTLMLTNTFMFNLRHPRKYLPRLNTTYLGEDGVEKEGRKFKDHRGIATKLFDPFDIIGLLKGNDKKDRWWENGMDGEVTDVKVVGGK
jgi:hypothetical protein